MSRAAAFGFSFKTLDGGDIKLADYSSRPIPVANMASLCGYSPQYARLARLARYEASQ
ncbi:hypothetical protein CAK95_25580 [Pseudorhodoplanes sinuspersici]|uniref:Uncharacterized protein n=1 Tax=Pseudorhodoplanes sinuspersici TaxID=1235591 RepID=A0A1W6ZXQ9_9HYPH|nr:hypothetical protein [Pseudorhodoplanes sinuspersici]ARQ02093.1 hypothetical protein CAK95_25580 [Pseudorhodoplanes sinuspersici]